MKHWTSFTILDDEGHATTFENDCEYYTIWMDEYRHFGCINGHSLKGVTGGNLPPVDWNGILIQRIKNERKIAGTIIHEHEILHQNMGEIYALKLSFWDEGNWVLDYYRLTGNTIDIKSTPINRNILSAINERVTL
ncbi:hypothetical protein [Alicyclobacillus mengziensis]|uniref:Uncharacterized protein n=1 Tax=Alicyclobacillus mengziensis TaxID=2931921 RepID=A0A9X7W1E9_9BACL|nr:hypothetical protein [Alicyclobacillus mengziensis]QSO48417.1 hypothetical protein JZ786_05365 [Alicyclobacillus mengziensis]